MTPAAVGQVWALVSPRDGKRYRGELRASGDTWLALVYRQSSLLTSVTTRTHEQALQFLESYRLGLISEPTAGPMADDEISETHMPKCPTCGAEETTRGASGTNGRMIRTNWSCRVCGHQWTTGRDVPKTDR
jgi:hypothetical protein